MSRATFGLVVCILLLGGGVRAESSYDSSRAKLQAIEKAFVFAFPRVRMGPGVPDQGVDYFTETRASRWPGQCEVSHLIVLPQGEGRIRLVLREEYRRYSDSPRYTGFWSKDYGDALQSYCAKKLPTGLIRLDSVRQNRGKAFFDSMQFLEALQSGGGQSCSGCTSELTRIQSVEFDAIQRVQDCRPPEGWAEDDVPCFGYDVLEPGSDASNIVTYEARVGPGGLSITRRPTSLPYD